MDYNLLICAADKQWMAIDINADGECDRISFDGNETIAVESSEAVTGFCAQILNYYNIDDFSDIELYIKIVVISAYSNLITDLFLQVKRAKSINIIDSKSIIPIYVLKKCIVKPGSVIDVRCPEKKFTLQVDENLVISYVAEKAGEEIALEPEYFSILFRFDCRNLISDEAELKALEEKYTKDIEETQKEIDGQKKVLSELKKDYDELEKGYIQLQNKIEERKFDNKRTILRFSTDKLRKQNSEELASSVLFCLMELVGKREYICKLLKADGDVVKKNTNLIEIAERYYTNDNEYEIRRKCVIEANADGRIFYLVKNNDSVQDNQAVVLVSDSADRRTDIMEWYKEMKWQGGI